MKLSLLWNNDQSPRIDISLKLKHKGLGPGSFYLSIFHSISSEYNVEKSKYKEAAFMSIPGHNIGIKPVLYELDEDYGAEECDIQLVRNLNGMYDEISDEIDAEIEAEEEDEDE